MTRINAGIRPTELIKAHLIAEHREIVRIPNNVRKYYQTKRENLFEDLPSEFVLGTGHVKFFYNKLEYLKRRYNNIYMECLKRGINVTDMRAAFTNLPPTAMGNWHATPEARLLLQQRLVRKNRNYQKQWPDVEPEAEPYEDDSKS